MINKSNNRCSAFGKEDKDKSTNKDNLKENHFVEASRSYENAEENEDCNMEIMPAEALQKIVSKSCSNSAISSDTKKKSNYLAS